MANEVWQGGNTNGSASINWNNPANWTNGLVPQAGDVVVLPAGTRLADLFGATTTIGSLTVSAGASADLTGNMTITGNLVDNGGIGVDYQQEIEGGGSTLTIDGALITTNAGEAFTIGNRFQTAPTTVIVGTLANTGAIDIAGNAGVDALAQLDVLSTAGIGGQAGILSGNFALGIGIAGGGGVGDALLDFAGGGLINTIENGSVGLTGPLAFIASGDATSSNSALSGALTVSNGASLNLADGASISLQSLIADGGVSLDSAIESSGGSSLVVSGMLTANNSGAPFSLGNEDQTAPVTVSAGAVTNTGGIDIGGNPGGISQAPVLAQLDIASTAGFGGLAGVLTGNVTLGMGIGGGGGPGDALLDFAGGGLISTIENGTLALNGPLAFLASGPATTTDSALSGPLTISASGGLLLQSGPSLATGPLTDAGSISIDTGFLAAGGSSLTVDGMLDVNGTLAIGRSAMVDAGPTVTATAGLVNSGTIDLNGDSGAGLAGVLDVDTAAGFGTPGDLTGTVDLTGFSLLDFTGGRSITSIDPTGNLFIDGTEAFLATGNATTSNSGLTNLAAIDGGFTLQDGAAVAVSGSLAIGSGTIGGNVNINAGAALAVDDTLLLNDGSLSVTSATISAGGLTNSAGIGIAAGTLDVSGVLDNAGNLNIGSAQLTTNATVSAGGFINTGSVELTGGAAAQAALETAGTAPATWTGSVTLAGDALLEFASGSIETIAANGEILLNGGQAFIADAGNTGTNSALADLSANAGGTVLLENGATVSTGPGVDFTNAAGSAGGIDGDRIGVDDIGFGGTGGSTLAIGGTLINTGNIFVGAPFLAAAAAIDAAALVNTGDLNIYGNTNNTAQGTVDIAGAAPSVWTGSLDLNFDALLEFGGTTGITTIAKGAAIDVNGAAARIALASAPTSDSALTGLSTNLGSLALTSGAAIVTSSGFGNAGSVTIGSASVLNLGSGLYNQEGGSTVVSGTLDAGRVDITGGTLELASGGIVNGGISFADTPGGTLQIDLATPAAMPTNVISGLVQGDTIDFANIANGSATLLGGNVLQLTASGGTTYNLQLDPEQDFAADTFTATAGAGTAITITGPGPYAASDPLMTNTDGTLVFDQVADNQMAFTTIGGLGPEWEFDGSGLLLGDGNPGFLIRDTGSVEPGALFVGEIANGQAQFTPVGGLGPEWRFEDEADFLGTGQSDFLIRNYGSVEPGALFLGQVVNGAMQYTSLGGLGLEWQFEGAGDFLNDGNQGFLIRNTGPDLPGVLDVGEVVGGAVQYTQIGGVGTEWNFEGTGDFLGDGNTGFLLWNSGSTDLGAMAIGEVVGGQLQFTDIGGVGPEWQFVGAGAYLGGTQTDFLLRNQNSGALVVGAVSGSTGNATANFTIVGGVGPEWNFHPASAALFA